MPTALQLSSDLIIKPLMHYAQKVNQIIHRDTPIRWLIIDRVGFDAGEYGSFEPAPGAKPMRSDITTL